MGFEGLLLGRTLLERYRIDALVGGGAMGVVYRATDLRLDRVVAAKVLSERALDPAARERSRARFRREALTAARLTHEHVVRTYDFGTDAAVDLDVLVMELLEGADLDAWALRHGPAPPALARELLAQAGRGLGAGHRLGLVHRDVKPSNLLVSERGGRPWLFVLDFGIVEMADAAGTLTKLTAAGFTPGTLRYASPEQIRGLGALSPASDVFSLGATAFELLTGEPAFDSAELAERLSAPAVLAGLLAEQGVPRDLVEVVARAVDPVPERRFADGDAFADAVLGADPRDASRWPPPPPAAIPPAEKWWAGDEAPEPAGATRPLADDPRTAAAPLSEGKPGATDYSTATSWLLVAIVVAILVFVFVFVVPRDDAAEQPVLPDAASQLTAPDSASPLAAPVDVEALIGGIRSEYQRLERVAPSLSRRSLELVGFSAEGGVADLYLEDGRLVKVLAAFFGESGRATEEYFFRGGELFFVYRRLHLYDEPFGSVQRVDEDRFYFHQGRMIRWLDSDREPVRADDDRFADQSAYLIDLARRFQVAERRESPVLDAAERR